MEGAACSGKVAICQYKSCQDLKIQGLVPFCSPFYVHSKTWFFDDKFMVCGSSNFNRRGYSHDSELDFAIYDQNRKFVKDLRMRVWLNRLNTQDVSTLVTSRDINDFVSGAKFWERPAEFGLALENNLTQLDDLAPRVHFDLEFPGKTSIVGQVAAALGKRGLWNIVVDPEGT